MHELSLAQSIVETVEQKAVACNARHVKCVRLRVGEANAIVADSLRFCFDMLTSFEPRLAGAQLVIDEVPHCARCKRCANTFAITHFVMRCPACQAADAEVVSGTELEILDMEIEGAADVSYP
jgi:hydrogenase nickel incorporation protein HypA/HybF